MPRKILAAMIIFFFLITLPVLAAKKITIPKGSTVQKLGSGHFRFITPDKKTVELTGLNIRGKSASFISIYDAKKNNNVITTSNRVILNHKGAAAVIRIPRGTQYVMIDDDIAWLKVGKKVPRGEYIMIDDDIAWLPIEITYEPDKK